MLLLSLPHTLDAYFQASSSILLSTTENEWVHTGGWKIIDGEFVFTRKSEHAHSIMWQSNCAINVVSRDAATCVVKLLIAVDLESTITQTKLTWM